MMLPPRLATLWQQLGIDPSVVHVKQLQIYEEAAILVIVGIASDGRSHALTPATATAWRALQAAAASAGHEIEIASAYRSVTRQVALIERKLNAGLGIDTILQQLAPPGCSEHHTGRAVDLYSPGGPIVEVAFAATPAFAWLSEHASQYGFMLSFPEHNRYGYLYEPWHWCYQPKPR